MRADATSIGPARNGPGPSRSPSWLRAVDHAVVLNLDRRRDRLESFLARAREAEIGPIERIAAIDGRQLPPSPEIRHLFRDNDFHYNCGVAGCALSHYRLWQRMASPAWPHSGLTAVFEDDVVFCRGFRRLWNEELAPRLPVDCELIYLGGIRRPEEQGVEWPAGLGPGLDAVPWDYVADEINAGFARPRRGGFCTYSYLIAPGAARALCRIVARQGIQRAIDGFLVDHWHCLRVGATVPLLCWSPFRGDTDIQRCEARLF